jgi:hypothetical protein
MREVLHLRSARLDTPIGEMLIVTDRESECGAETQLDRFPEFLAGAAGL